MTKIQYLSLSKPERFVVNFGNGFKNFFKGIGRWFKAIPNKLLKLWNHKLTTPFKTLVDAWKKGSWGVRGNFLVFGFYQLLHKEVMRGLLYLLYEVVFFWFFFAIGITYLSKLGTLGTFSPLSHYLVDPAKGSIGSFSGGDESFQILLYSIVTIFLMLLFVVLWYFSIRDAKSLHDNICVGKLSKNSQFFKDMVDSKYHTLLLAVPLVGLVAFTIIPVVFMITIGFTNYDSMDRVKMFDWVGFDNYNILFSGFSSGADSNVVGIFFKILAWTLLWALIATFTNYFLGMVIALLINRKGIKLKKMWRTILIFTIAVPQFVSLMLISRMLDRGGFLTNLFIQAGWVKTNSSAFLDKNTVFLARAIIIIINMWVGVPYTMLICSGILMNIPEDLYESARIDGASTFKMYRAITLPYMLFITGPYLLSQFIGNINNFNIIYLLSKGGPSFGLKLSGFGDPGETDLLITWIYKMSMESKKGEAQNFAMASVLGVLIFVVIAFFSLVFYGRSNAVKNEEDFS